MPLFTMTLLIRAIQNQTNQNKIAFLCPCSNKTALRLGAKGGETKKVVRDRVTLRWF